jgi:hypothetical protein
MPRSGAFKGLTSSGANIGEPVVAMTTHHWHLQLQKVKLADSLSCHALNSGTPDIQL